VPAQLVDGHSTSIIRGAPVFVVVELRGIVARAALLSGLLITSVLMMIAGILACLEPARRALRITPSTRRKKPGAERNVCGPSFVMNREVSGSTPSTLKEI
jgi:hypothetical protein